MPAATRRLWLLIPHRRRGPYTAGTADTFDVDSDFTDPDSDTLTYTLDMVTPTSAAITFSGSTVSISTAATANTYSIQVTASDGEESVTHTYMVVVNPAVALTGPGTQVYNAGMAITPVTLDAASGGTAPYSYTLTGPNGADLSEVARAVL